MQDRICRQLNQVVRADVPVTFLVPMTITQVASRRIRGVQTFAWGSDFLASLENLTLDTTTSPYDR